MISSEDVMNGDHQITGVVNAAILLAEVLNDDGQPRLVFVCPVDIPLWKRIGMIQVALDQYRNDALDATDDTDDGDIG